MEGGIVHDNDHVFIKVTAKHLVYPLVEGGCVAGAIKEDRFNEFFMVQGC